MEKPFLIKSPVLKDDRGIFSPTPIKFGHKHPLHLRIDWIQTNLSINQKPYTFRGLHFQKPYPQSKLVKVISGSIIDFLVDIHPERKYGEVQKFKMEAGDMLYVPKDFAHGFITLEELTVVQYLVDEDYYPQHEGSISWKSVPEVYEVMKEFEDQLIISEKDKNAILFENFNK